ncbi:MAG: hypothetical protein WC302_02830 [Candidatus Paceibacterota bacterium]|jgi:hypothetical protein
MKKILIITIVIALGCIIYWQFNVSSQPSIALISPNGGEVLEEGSVYTIKWETKNIPADDKVAINIRRIAPPPLPADGQEFDPIIFINLENTGSMDWHISNMYPEGNYVLGITSYASIPVTDPISDESDTTFAIKSTSWQTYINQDFGYSIDYPSTWTFREFPDTKTGAGFRPLNSADGVASECIVVSARGTAENEYNTPFYDYVQRAAAVEIQNYERLDSIEPVETASGLLGYRTTWVYRTFDGQEKSSLPIAYFDNKKTSGQLKYKTVQIALETEDCMEIYNQMLPSFNYEDKGI